MKLKKSINKRIVSLIFLKLDKHECCPNLVISGSEDVNVLYPRFLGSYKGHGRPNERKAYQIENSTFHFEWTPEYRRYEYGRFAWSVSIVNVQHK